MLLAGAAAVVAAFAGRSDSPFSKEDVEQLHAALYGPTQHWGRIEVQGMRPAVADLVSGEGVPAETIGGEARAWQGGLREVGTELAAIRTTDALRPIVDRFRAALEPYLEAARLFEEATVVPVGDGRLVLVDRGIEAAKRGTRLYNEASMKLQAARRTVGLPTSPDFPDHPADS